MAIILSINKRNRSPDNKQLCLIACLVSLSQLILLLSLASSIADNSGHSSQLVTESPRDELPRNVAGLESLIVDKERDGEEFLIRRRIDLEAVSKGLKLDRSTDQAATKKVSYWTRVKGFLGTRLAPAKSFVNILSRYRRWFRKYKNFQKEAANATQLKSAVEVFKEEYAKVDKLLMDHECELSDKDESLSSESVEFVVSVLANLIDRLEKKLEDLETAQNFEQSDYSNREDQDQDEISAERIKEAMDRAKRILAMKAANLATREAVMVAKFAALTIASDLLLNSDAIPEEVAYYLAPLISIPLGARYFNSIKGRSLLATVRQFNPRKDDYCKFKPRKLN